MCPRESDPLRPQLGELVILEIGDRRTYILTDVTSEHPVAYEMTQLTRYRASVLDGQVRDAQPGVDRVIAIERSRRARNRAGTAGAAARLRRQVGRQIEIGQDPAQEGERAQLPAEDIGIAPLPAEPCPGREGLVHCRSGVNE